MRMRTILTLGSGPWRDPSRGRPSPLHRGLDRRHHRGKTAQRGPGQGRAQVGHGQHQAAAGARSGDTGGDERWHTGKIQLSLEKQT